MADQTRVEDFTIAFQREGSAAGAATVDLTNVALDARVNNLYVARHTFTAGSASATLTFNSGVLDVNNAYVGFINSAPTGTLNSTGTIIVGGTGRLDINNGLALGQSELAFGIGNGNLLINGGTVRLLGSATLSEGGAAAPFGLVNSSLNMSSGTLSVTGTASVGSASNKIDNGTLSNGVVSVNLGAGSAPAVAPINIATFTANNSKIALTGTNLSVGSFAVVDYDAYTNAASFSTMSTFTAPRVVANLVDDGSQIFINVSAVGSAPKWDGSVSGDWDIDNGSGTGTANWKETVGGLSTKYRENATIWSSADTVLFDDTATGATTVNVSPQFLRMA